MSGGALWIVLFLNLQRKGDCQGPMETKVKWVSNLLPTYSICDRMLYCRVCILKKWDVAATLDQQLKVWFCFGTESASRPLVCFCGLIDTTIKGLTILLSAWEGIDYHIDYVCDVMYQCSRQRLMWQDKWYDII